MKLEEKLLKELRKYRKLAIAFSGGSDSSLLAWAAKCSDVTQPLLLYASTPFGFRREKDFALKWADKNDFNIEIVELDPLSDTEIKCNPNDRCYWCKKLIYKNLLKKAEHWGCDAFADGVNVDDLGEYRPGLKAAAELGVAHPLVDAGFRKREVRLLSRHYALPTWKRPGSACLATRIPHDTPLELESMAKAEKAEEYLSDLGFTGSRVRVIGQMAKIEVIPVYFKRFLRLHEEIVTEIKSLGFNQVCLDLAGYRPPKRRQT